MLRKLVKEDYFKGFLDLVNYFTRSPRPIDYKEFCRVFEEVQNSIILVIEEDEKIIATGKIIIEQKFHNNLSKMGHIEDIVVLEEYRGKGHASKIINELVSYGKQENCYKIILSCSDDLISFYKSLDFRKKGIEMCIYL